LTAAGNAFDELEVGPIIAANLGAALTPLAGFQFLGTGPKSPPFEVPTLGEGNIARATDAVPFASLTRAGHEVFKLNDGLYGDSDGWNAVNGAVTVPRSYAAYAGIYWTDGVQTVEEIAVGRDNKGGSNNRHTGLFAVHYTADPLNFVDVNNAVDEPAVAAAKWIAIGVLDMHPLNCPTAEDPLDLLRHVYELTTPVEARAIRVSAWPRCAATHFDELEIFGDTIISPGAEQIAGDCNQDGTVDLSDVICLLGFLFQNNPAVLPCATTAANLALMDCNNDGGIDLSDGIYKLAFLFQGGPAPVQGTGCFTIAECPQNPGC
jgi:hypothetical protein